MTDPTTPRERLVARREAARLMLDIDQAQMADKWFGKPLLDRRGELYLASIIAECDRDLADGHPEHCSEPGCVNPARTGGRCFVHDGEAVGDEGERQG